MLAFLSRLFRCPAAVEPAWIDVEELQRRMTEGESVALVDVRGPDEFNTPPGHLPAAINIPLPELPNRIAEVAAFARPVVLICKTDRRSAAAAKMLLAAGLRDVTVLRGGNDRWYSAIGGTGSPPSAVHGSPDAAPWGGDQARP